LQHWWDVFVDDHELVLLAVRDGERLAGVLPLMRTGNQITFAGDTEICDYMDMIAPNGDYAALWTAALRSLGEEPWDEIALWAVREDSPTLSGLPEACRELGLRFVSEQEDVCPQLELPADWEEYVSSLGKKDRHELRRKLRKLPQAGAVEVEVLDSPAELESGLGDFLRMHRESRADKANFMTDQMEGFFRKVVVALAAEGVAEMTFLKLADVRAACLLCFKAGDEYLLYNSGYDPAYAGFSVGLLSKALALQRAIERGYKRFDFLRGHEHYKYDLGARDVNVYRCAIRRA
jgi:CelD/BcsL family acetyltransferase involved in cellulose biosynthesis